MNTEYASYGNIWCSKKKTVYCILQIRNTIRDSGFHARLIEFRALGSHHIKFQHNKCSLMFAECWVPELNLLWFLRRQSDIHFTSMIIIMDSTVRHRHQGDIKLKRVDYGSKTQFKPHKTWSTVAARINLNVIEQADKYNWLILKQMRGRPKLWSSVTISMIQPSRGTKWPS